MNDKTYDEMVIAKQQNFRAQLDELAPHWCAPAGFNRGLLSIDHSGTVAPKAMYPQLFDAVSSGTQPYNGGQFNLPEMDGFPRDYPVADNLSNYTISVPMQDISIATSATTVTCSVATIDSVDRIAAMETRIADLERVVTELRKNIEAAEMKLLNPLDKPFDPTALRTEDFIFPHPGAGRGSMVETLPAETSLRQVQSQSRGTRLITEPTKPEVITRTAEEILKEIRHRRNTFVKVKSEAPIKDEAERILDELHRRGTTQCYNRAMGIIE